MAGQDKHIEPGAQGRPVSDEVIFKVSKEIVVKFIEVGRLSPAAFEETFRKVYQTVHDTVRKP